MQCLGSLFKVPIYYIWMSNDSEYIKEGFTKWEIKRSKAVWRYSFLLKQLQYVKYSEQRRAPYAMYDLTLSQPLFLCCSHFSITATHDATWQQETNIFKHSNKILFKVWDKYVTFFWLQSIHWNPLMADLWLLRSRSSVNSSVNIVVWIVMWISEVNKSGLLLHSRGPCGSGALIGIYANNQRISTVLGTTRGGIIISGNIHQY